MPLCDFHYFSDVLQKQTAANIILPNPALPGPYHVMFLLHGLSDDYTAWMRRTSIERYVSELPLMVVMPDGGRGFYSDAVEGYAYGTAIGVELPKIIRTYFPTRDSWSITGLSMGGYGAARLSMTYPDLFVSAHCHSSAIGFGHVPDYLSDDRGKEFGRILGPNPVGGPNDLNAVAAALEPAKRPKLRIDCGTEDHLVQDSRRFHDYLATLGYEHEYAEFPGEHTWEYWDEHVKDALAFHGKNLGF